MEEILITGASGFIGGYLAQCFPEAKSIGHADCDLVDWKQVEKFGWEGKVIVNCAHIGQYGQDKPGIVEENVLLLANLRRRWPDAKIISFGSGAMYDKSKPVVLAKEDDLPVYPTDLYGLSKRMMVDLSDVTLIPFGIFAKTRFVESVLNHINNREPVVIFQDVLFSWVNLVDLPGVIEWSIKKGSGRYNLCGYRMLLSELAIFLGAKDIVFQKQGVGLEYTGLTNKDVKLNACPSF